MSEKERNSYIKGMNIAVHSLLLSLPNGLSSREAEKKYLACFGNHRVLECGFESFENFLLTVPNVFKCGNVFKARPTKETADLHSMILKQNGSLRNNRVSSSGRLFKSSQKTKHVEISEIDYQPDRRTYVQPYFQSLSENQNEEWKPVFNSKVILTNERMIDCQSKMIDKNEKEQQQVKCSTVYQKDHHNENNRKPKLSSKFDLKGLIQKTDSFNKSIDKKVIPDYRVAFENDFEKLKISNSHIKIKGRGASFGKMRSSLEIFNTDTERNTAYVLKEDVSDSECSFLGTKTANDSCILSSAEAPCRTEIENFDLSSTEEPSYSDNSYVRTVGGGFGSRSNTSFLVNIPKKAANNSKQDLKSKNTMPLQRKNENLSRISTSSSSSSNQTVQLDPDNPLLKMNVRPVNHQYYSMFLCGEAREDVLAQKIEQTVRYTEMPPRRIQFDKKKWTSPL